jgi:hypothetical protein
VQSSLAFICRPALIDLLLLCGSAVPARLPLLCPAAAKYRGDGALDGGVAEEEEEAQPKQQQQQQQQQLKKKRQRK